MLTTLFGDLEPPREPARRRDRAAAETPDFAITESFDDTDEAGNARELDPHLEEVLVGHSPAQSIREHFATARADLDAATSMITLLDPSRLWAPAVIKALSDATGAPVERVHLLERGTLRSLALIERTAVMRRTATPLKVYHAEIRALGAEHDEIANALAERSHMTAVIFGTLQPQAVDALLRSLLAATRQPNWHCPQLVFLLPPGAGALGQRILGQEWPRTVLTVVLNESLSGASSVWNTVLGAWDAAVEAREAAVGAAEHGSADAAALARHLAGLARTEGVLACATVDLADGRTLGVETGQITFGELARQARALVAARQAHTGVNEGLEPPDELLVTVGPRLLLLRAHVGHPAAPGLLLVLDRARANLALLRFKLLEAERYLR